MKVYVKKSRQIERNSLAGVVGRAVVMMNILNHFGLGVVHRLLKFYVRKFKGCSEK